MPPARKKLPPPGPPVGAPHARIHIAAVGFEVERVTVPLEADRADRVYLLTRAERDAAAPFVEEVVRRLRRAAWPVEVRVVRTDLWDVFQALSSLRTIFETERRTERNAREVLPLRVNVSTGTKITAIAGTLACMLWNGSPYYAHVSKAWYSDRTPRVGEFHDVVDQVEPVGVYQLPRARDGTGRGLGSPRPPRGNAPQTRIDPRTRSRPSGAGRRPGPLPASAARTATATPRAPRAALGVRAVGVAGPSLPGPTDGAGTARRRLVRARSDGDTANLT